MVYQIKHEISSPIYNSCLLPIGQFLHKDLLDAKLGDTVRLYDGVAIFCGCCIISVRLQKKAGRIIGAFSPIGEQLCLMIYGISLVNVYKLFKANWPDCYEDKLLFVTYTNAKKDE